MEPFIPAVARQVTAEVAANVPVARDTFRLSLMNRELARSIRPGQFVMIRPDHATAPLLGRPFAVYDVTRTADGTAVRVEIVYEVVGKGTQALARLRPGDSVVAWGPLGNGFGPGPGADQAVVFVAGGIGVTPFLALGRWWLGRASYGGDSATMPPTATASVVTLLYGVRSSEFAIAQGDFDDAGIAVELTTDDGTSGPAAYPTDLLASRLERGERPGKVVGCGPPAMLAALARLTARYGVACDVSIENHMACGFGACFSCVAPIRQSDGSTDLRRVCVEGPIFPAAAVAWPEPAANQALG